MDADDTEGVKLADRTVHDARHFGHQITKKPIFPATTLCASLFFCYFISTFSPLSLSQGEKMKATACAGGRRGGEFICASRICPLGGAEGKRLSTLF